MRGVLAGLAGLVGGVAMSGVGTVVFQAFLVFAVCAIAIRIACDMKRERDARQLERGGWIIGLVQNGLIRRRER